jgi:hypothetical protein
MTHRIPPSVRRFSPCAVALLAMLLLSGGCYTEHWAYRAVPNVNVAHSHVPGSQGPLVLVSLDDASATPEAPHKTSAQMIDSLTADQIARFDPKLKELMRKSKEFAKAYDDAQEKYGADDQRTRQAKLDADESRHKVDDYVTQFKTDNRDKVVGEPGAASTAKPSHDQQIGQTVLMGSVTKSFGDRASSVTRTFVLMLDGQPRPGTYWLTPDNSMLISYSSWSPPSRTRVGLTGSVKVLAVNGNKIDAQICIRETTEADTGEFVSEFHYLDPAYYQTPWVVNSHQTFIITDKNDPAFDKAGVHWEQATVE